MNIHKLLTSLCYLSCLALTACSTAPVVPEAPAIIAAPVLINENDDLMAYYLRTRLLSQGELPKMLAELTTLSKSPQRDMQRDMQRAILLGFMRGNGDLTRAQTLLDGVIKSGDAEAEHLKALAYFLSSHYAEWRRLDEAIEKQNQQLKEAQRRFDQLSQKLEDLKAIERQLPTRPRSSSAPPAASDISNERAR